MITGRITISYTNTICVHVYTTDINYRPTSINIVFELKQNKFLSVRVCVFFLFRQLILNTNSTS